MSRIKNLKSINSYGSLYAHFIVLNKKGEKVKIEYEIIRGNVVKVYILFQDQVDKLKEIDINLAQCNNHHLVQKALKKKLKKMLKKIKPNSTRRQFIKLKREINFKLVISLPFDIHTKYNRIFQGCMIPRLVLWKLDEILESETINGDCRNDVVDLFAFISILIKDISSIDINEIRKFKEINDGIITAKLLKVLGITEDDVRKYISDIFFYPDYQTKSKQFEMLLDLYNQK